MPRGRAAEPRILDAQNHPRKYAGVRVVADYLGIGVARVHWLIDEGKLRAIEVESPAGPKTRKVDVLSIAEYESIARTA
jgi:hypothetical protein